MQRLDWGPGPSIAALVVVPSAALGVAIQGLHRCSTGAALGVAIQGLHRCSDWARGRQLLHLWCPGGCDRGAKNLKESQRIPKIRKESLRNLRVSTGVREVRLRIPKNL